METNRPTYRPPWAWVPSLYFAEGIPYVVVQTISVIMYKRMGISNSDIALFTSLLYWPWAIKPLWSPFVDMFSKKRLWVVSMEFIIAVSLVVVAFVLPLASFLTWTLVIFAAMAFSSATHDIAADGFYMLALEPYQQAAFSGVRSTFYRIATIVGSGLLVMLAGNIETGSGGNIPFAWSISFGILAGMFILLFAYHRLILPYPAADGPTLADKSRSVWNEFVQTFVIFFKKKDIVTILFFLLFYRFAEAQLVKLVSPFLLDPRGKGGLGLSTSEVGIVYGTVGIVALLSGGLLGGFVISKKGLKYWLWIMVFSIHLPDVMFIYLSQVQPENFLLVNIAVAIEQFGYGFGFTAYMLYMLMVSQGDHKTAHYAICTGFMALGMMIPGLFSGYIQEWLGYKNFFLWVFMATIPGFIVAAVAKIDPLFGKKVEQPQQ
ncbi:MAG: MFS transporter [Bacteroidota bacterium]|jgi:PAT family beta-lactamase induction signal transducer AmpG